MVDNYSEVQQAHDKDDLLFGTIESWVAYVGVLLSRNAMDFPNARTESYRWCPGRYSY
jgi:glycerol kinase